MKVERTFHSHAMNPEIDQYIYHAAPFAQPILIHLRELVHQTCPDVEEKMKWSFPHFDYKGPFLSMAAFKKHCAFTFWKADLMDDPKGILYKSRSQAMGHLGKITSLSDLPDEDDLVLMIQEAMRLNDEGIKLPRKPKVEHHWELDIPDWFMEALRTNKKALEAFEKFSYSHQKEYLEWVVEAKKSETRKRRLQQTIEWLAEGKSRNWRYK